jgi:uroporphyrinogen decarboxylase
MNTFGVKSNSTTQLRLLSACRKMPVDFTPVWFMRQAGRYLPEYRRLREKYDLLALCKTPELSAEVTLQPVKILGVDAAILFADLLLPFEPMGVPFHFAKGEGPVIENPIRTPKDVEKLKPVFPEVDLSYVLSAVKLIKKELENRLPLIGFAGAPFTLASYLIEGGHSQNFLLVKRFMREEKEAWHLLMEKLSIIVANFSKAQIQAGADAVQLFDSWAGILSPEDYQDFVLPYSRKILSEVSQTGAPSIHFATGNAGMLEIFSQAGGDVIGIDWRIALDDAWKKIGEKAIQGNLDPALLFAEPSELEMAVRKILKKAGGKPGHIFNLGHGVLPGTPVDNVKRVVEWVRLYSQKKE